MKYIISKNEPVKREFYNEWKNTWVDVGIYRYISTLCLYLDILDI